MEADATVDVPGNAAAARPGGAPPACGQRPLRGFAFDAVMAVVLMLVIALLAGAGWALVQGIGAVLSGQSARGAMSAATAFPGVMALLWMTALSTGGASLVLYYWRRRATPAERAASVHAARQPATWKRVAVVAVVVFFGTGAMQWLIARAGIEIAPTNKAIIELGLLLHPAAILAFAVVIAPAYEELLFRRVLFGRLLAAGKPWRGILLSSAVFALMHEVPGVTGNPLEATLLLWLLYGFIGAALAWVYWRTGTLWASFAVHALNNLASCLLLLGGLG